ncbi:hypothetical protein EMCRGX_G019420 [Ephydatia muelleri]
MVYPFAYIDSVSSLKSCNLSTAYTNPDTVDAELGKEITAAPSLFNNYANALHWIMASNYGAQLLHNLDYFLLVGPPGKDTKMVPAERFFLCHLIDLSTTVRKLHHHFSKP